MMRVRSLHSQCHYRHYQYNADPQRLLLKKESCFVNKNRLLRPSTLGGQQKQQRRLTPHVRGMQLVTTSLSLFRVVIAATLATDRYFRPPSKMD